MPASGYYGLGPGNKVADQLSDFDRALRSLPLENAIEVLDTLEALTRTVVRQPKEQAHRQLTSGDDKGTTLLRSVPESLNALREMGWHVDGDPMVLPADVKLDFQKHVVKIMETKSFYVKEREKAKKAAKLSADPAKAEMLRQIEIDRREHAAGDLRAASSTEGALEASSVCVTIPEAQSEGKEAASASAPAVTSEARGTHEPPSAKAVSEAALRIEQQEEARAENPAQQQVNLAELAMERRQREEARQRVEGRPKDSATCSKQAAGNVCNGCAIS